MTTVPVTNKRTELTQNEVQALIDRAVNQRLAEWLRHEADALELANAYTWEQIRAQHPNVWVLVEALDGYTDKEHGKWIVPHMRLVQAFGDDSHPVLERYGELRHADPKREYFFYHTSHETLDIGVLGLY